MKFYAGIGSRSAPPSARLEMTMIAKRLEALGYVLRSGGAEGADSAFEAGVKSEYNKRIYLPWRGFNGKKGIVCGDDPEWQFIAKQHHPRWRNLAPAARLLMGRNTAQVIGRGLENDSKFVVCWTPNGLGEGGTGQAIRIARAHGIPVFDLADPIEQAQFYLLLGVLEHPPMPLDVDPFA
jgi:hypothetical protein